MALRFGLAIMGRGQPVVPWLKRATRMAGYSHPTPMQTPHVLFSSVTARWVCRSLAVELWVRLIADKEGRAVRSYQPLFCPLSLSWLSMSNLVASRLGTCSGGRGPQPTAEVLGIIHPHICCARSLWLPLCLLWLSNPCVHLSLSSLIYFFIYFVCASC